MDVCPTDASVCADVERRRIVVLRSFGKFFGLAGLRLGFAIASPDLIERLDATRGPWGGSGPTLLIGEAALADRAWQDQTLTRLTEAAARLDELLRSTGLQIVGGTPLYRLTRSEEHTSEIQSLTNL